MPAPLNVIPHVDFALKVADKVIGGATGGSLSFASNPVDVTHDGAAYFASSLAGARSWTLGFESFYLEEAGVVPGDGLSISVGGDALKGVKDMSLDFSMAAIEVINNTTGLDRVVAPSNRSATLSVNLDYFDPAGTGAEGLEAFLDEMASPSDAALAVVWSVGGSDFTGTFRPTGFELQKQQGQVIGATLSLASTGAITNDTANQSGTGIAALLDSYFAAGGSTPLTVLAGMEVADATEWTGSGYVESLSFKAAVDAALSISGSIAGSGPLTRQATVVI